MLLEASRLVGGYGGADILKGVSVSVDEDHIAVIVGPNGAGKSTALKALFGYVRLREGSVSFAGRDITNMATDRIVPLGLAYVPQERNIFPTLTIQENLEMGAFLRREGIGEALERVYALFPALAERRHTEAGVLSGGQRQMLAIGRALMLDPKVILLDEPTAGLSPLFIDKVFELVIDIHRTGVGILMVEQNARQALEMATHGYVLVNGVNRHEGSGRGLLDDPEVLKSFLGG